MGAKTLGVLGHHQVSAENAGKIIDELGLPEGYTDEEVAAALEWVIINGLSGRAVCCLNCYHELESVLRALKLMLTLEGEDLDFFLKIHKLAPLPRVEPVEAKKIQKLIFLILERQSAIELIRDAFPLD